MLRSEEANLEHPPLSARRRLSAEVQDQVIGTEQADENALELIDSIKRGDRPSPEVLDELLRQLSTLQEGCGEKDR